MDRFPGSAERLVVPAELPILHRKIQCDSSEPQRDVGSRGSLFITKFRLSLSAFELQDTHALRGGLSARCVRASVWPLQCDSGVGGTIRGNRCVCARGYVGSISSQNW